MQMLLSVCEDDIKDQMETILNNWSSTDESITGDALVALVHSDLKDMGVNSVGHRMTILKCVYDLKVKHNMPIEADHFVPLCKSTAFVMASNQWTDFGK